MQTKAGIIASIGSFYSVDPDTASKMLVYHNIVAKSMKAFGTQCEIAPAVKMQDGIIGKVGEVASDLMSAASFVPGAGLIAAVIKRAVGGLDEDNVQDAYARGSALSSDGSGWKKFGRELADKMVESSIARLSKAKSVEEIRQLAMHDMQKVTESIFNGEVMVGEKGGIEYDDARAEMIDGIMANQFQLNAPSTSVSHAYAERPAISQIMKQFAQSASRPSGSVISPKSTGRPAIISQEIGAVHA